MWYYKDNEERLLERDTPVRSCDTASLSEDFEMTASPVLYAKGYDKTDGVTPIYFWGLGSYKYEIEVRKNSYYAESEVFESSYEAAMNKFENLIDLKTGVLMWYNRTNLESIPNGLS